MCYSQVAVAASGGVRLGGVSDPLGHWFPPLPCGPGSPLAVSTVTVASCVNSSAKVRESERKCEKVWESQRKYAEVRGSKRTCEKVRESVRKLEKVRESVRKPWKV